ncbi:MAG: phosphatase PAP2 family protein, partial [bacterium]
IIGLSLIYVYRFINNRKHIFAKYHPYILALNIISIYTLSKMIEDVVDNESIIKLDTWINANIVHLWNPLLNVIMIAINNIFTPTNTLILCIVLLAFRIYKKNWHQALVLFFTLGFASLTDLIIEPLVHRVRPENAIINATGYSFPRGHTILATIFFIMLIYSFKDKFKGKAKSLFILFNILMILLIGFDRVYLNVHWFSDTIAGLSIALFWFTFTNLAIHILVAIRFKIVDLIGYKSAERLKKLMYKY